VLRGELESIMEKLRRRIDDIRGRSQRISPAGYLPPETLPAVPAMLPRPSRLRLITLAAVFVTIGCFVVLWRLLAWRSGQLIDQLQLANW
jgi:hypothetical protein